MVFRLERAQFASQRCPIGSSGKRPLSYARDTWLDSKSEGKMLRGAFRHCGVITAIAFSAAMFISDARFNVAEAQGKPRAEDLGLRQRTTRAVQWQSNDGRWCGVEGNKDS